MTLDDTKISRRISCRGSPGPGSSGGSGRRNPPHAERVVRRGLERSLDMLSGRVARRRSEATVVGYDLVRPVIFVYTGKDFHGAGCACGQCNANGHAYGIAVFPADTDPDDLSATDPIDVLYGPSESAVERLAQEKYPHRVNQ